MDDFTDFWKAFGGLNGFEVLRKYVKQSNDMCRMMANIIQERVDLETTYSKSLSKISARLAKTGAQCLGTMEGAWQAVANSMAEEAEYHRQLASSMEEFVLQPMRNLAESYHKSRKPVEAAVEKTSRALITLRGEESRLKKLAYSQARDSEKSFESLANARVGRGGSGADKEVGKLEKKSRSCDEVARKSEKEYYDLALKAEASRLDWEASVYKGCAQLQILEVDRLKQCHEMLKKYHYNLSAITSSHRNLSDKLNSSMQTVNIRDDMKKLVEQRGCGPSQPEQLLVDFYAEDMTIPMDRDRREHYLKSYYAFAWQDKEREQKSKEGIEKLLSVYKDNPKFSDTDNQEEIRHKLISADALLNYLEACQFKFSCSLAMAKKTAKPQHRLAGYLEFTKDRHGLPQSILRMPMNELTFPAADGYMSVVNRRDPSRQASAGELSDDYDEDFDEPDEPEPLVQPTVTPSAYSQPQRFGSTKMASSSTSGGGGSLSRTGSQVGATRGAPVGSSIGGGGSLRAEARNGGSSRQVIGWCKAKYDFEPRDSDELGMRTGEVVSIYNKVDPTWWEGELNGRVGFFPSNYVEEF